MQERYSRNAKTLSADEQSILSASAVCIAGLGGLGGSVAEMLARTGIGSLILVDGDVFETSNLNRQLLCTEDVLGQSKAAVAKNRIHLVNSSVRVKAIDTFLTPENAPDFLKGADLIVDCLDSIPARFELENAARAMAVPLVSGAVAGTCGQVTTIFPEDMGLKLVYGPADTIPPHGAEATLGTLSFSALLVAAIQASEAVKVLLGRGEPLRNSLVIIDLMSGDFQTVSLL